MWKLKSLNISFRDYGELRGKYIGTISFDNAEQEAFTCNLTPEKCAEFLKLVQKEVMNNASDLKDKLQDSMKELINSSAQPVLHIEAK